MSIAITGVVQRRSNLDDSTTPAELYTQAVECLESETKRLHGVESPVFPRAAYRAVEALQRATREVRYAISCIESAERLERED